MIEGGALSIAVSNGPGRGRRRELRGNEGAGVGLDNVRHRLEAVFGTRATLTAGAADGRFVATSRSPSQRARDILPGTRN